MKPQTEIEGNLKDIEESNVELNEYMKGYKRALKWVLDEME